MNRLMIALLVLLPALDGIAAPKVTAARCPDEGLQPQVEVDGEGTVHLIYLKGKDGACDVFYCTSKDGGQSWSAPLRVNSQPGAAIATGTVRGAHLALGRGGRPHVAWMGSDKALPKAPRNAVPMLYARLNETGDAFEKQRNVITSATGLDGGGSVAADAEGNVYVAWHASPPGMRGEMNRTVWLATSKDDGRTFTAEKRMFDDTTGACGCCGMRLGVDAKGRLLALYRAANSDTRDIFLAGGKSPTKVETWTTKTCPMSTAAFARIGDQELAAWETAGQVSFARLDAEASKPGETVAAPGKGAGRKHPALAANKDGVLLFAWSEGTGWQRGGSVAWQLYDASFKPLENAGGGQQGLPVWSKPAAFSTPGGDFVVLY